MNSNDQVQHHTSLVGLARHRIAARLESDFQRQITWSTTLKGFEF